MMKLRFILSMILLFLFTLSGCGSEEEKLRAQIKKLETQHQKIRKRNQALIKENLKLKQTAQYQFQQGIEIFKKAESIIQFESAKKYFNDVILKYPNSDLITKANEYIDSINYKIKTIHLKNLFNITFDELIVEGKFKDAKSLLNKNKKNISKEDYNQFSLKIQDAKDKPLVTTINRLVANFSKLQNSRSDNVLRMENQKVKINVRVIGIDRSLPALLAYGEKTYGEERINVFYDNSNMLEYFTEKKSDRYEIYEVIGKVKLYRDYESFYIDAESINYITYNKSL